MTKIKKLFYLFFPIVAGTIIGLITRNAMNYNSMVKPSFSPPGYVFPIVWSILYLLMGYSYYLFKKEYPEETKTESIIYYSQLFVNLTWSIFFFVVNAYLFTAVWTIILLVLIITFIILMIKKNKVSAYLNIPYVLWVAFALFLTIRIFMLN